MSGVDIQSIIRNYLLRIVNVCLNCLIAPAADILHLKSQPFLAILSKHQWSPETFCSKMFQQNQLVLIPKVLWAAREGIM